MLKALSSVFQKSERKSCFIINYNYFCSYKLVSTRFKKRIFMEIHMKKEATKTVVAIEGRLDTIQAEKFMNVINQMDDDSLQNEIEVDCSQLEYISSSGLRAFIVLLKNTQKANGKVTLKNLNTNVKAVFDMTGFSALFGL